MSEFKRNLSVGLIVAIVSAVLAWYFYPSTPAPFARCTPILGTSPLTVVCFNESENYSTLVWDLGDGTHFKDKEVISHTYNDAKKYIVRLTAHGKGKDIFEQEINVISAMLPTSTAVTKAFKINNTKDNHPNTFTTDSETFTDIFKADPGHKILEATLVTDSAARATNIVTNISDDRTQVEISYKLTSGPALDKYRGWLRGELVVSQEK